jgi:hypothetical protein
MLEEAGYEYTSTVVECNHTNVKSPMHLRVVTTTLQILGGYGSAHSVHYHMLTDRPGTLSSVD